MSQVTTILSRNETGVVIPAGDKSVSDLVLVAPIAIAGSVAGDGAVGSSIRVLASSDQGGTITVWQGSDPTDFSGLPGVPPLASRVVTDTSPIVAGTPLSFIVPVKGPLVVVQYENGGVAASEVRLHASIVYV